MQKHFAVVTGIGMLAVAGIVVSQQAGLFDYSLKGDLDPRYPRYSSSSSVRAEGYYFADCESGCLYGEKGNASYEGCMLTYNAICSESFSSSSSENPESCNGPDYTPPSCSNENNPPPFSTCGKGYHIVDKGCNEGTCGCSESTDGPKIRCNHTFVCEKN